MTTLDTFLNTIPEDIQLLFSHQQTPTHIYVSMVENEFIKLIEDYFPNEKITLQFVEKKGFSELLLHVIIKKKQINIQVTFNIVSYTNETKERILSTFPSAEIYLQNL